MTEGKEKVALFAEALARTLNRDKSDPEFFLADSHVMRLNEDGTAWQEIHGAEAILIVRGPEEYRAKAIARLLAEIETR